MQIIEAVLNKDKVLLDSHIHVFNPYPKRLSGKAMLLSPFGLCVNFVDYDADEDFRLQIYGKKYNYLTEEMFVFVTDPAMLTYSSIDQESHQGTQIIGIENNTYNIYNVEVVMKDSDNPVERHLCSDLSYSDCVDQQTHDFFFQVIQHNDFEITNIKGQ